jgi:hypothetical protein
VTIRKGEEWGTSVPRPGQLVIATSDRELAALVGAGERAALGVSSGDVNATVGAPTDRDPMQQLPLDLLRIEADGVSHIAVAHVIVRRSWWRGGIVAVLNVDRVGRWNVAPRAHPNDGRFDVVAVEPKMTIRQRLQARRRLLQGTHVPHPAISTRTGAHEEWHFDRPQRLFVDGAHVGSVQDLAVVIEADAYVIHV